MVIIMLQGKKEADTWVPKDPQSRSTSIGPDGQLGYLNVNYDLAGTSDYKLRVRHGTYSIYEINDLSSCSISNGLEIRAVSWGYKNPTHMSRESWIECYDGSSWKTLGIKDTTNQADSIGSGSQEERMYDGDYDTGAIREASDWKTFSGSWSSAIYELELFVVSTTPLCYSNSDCGTDGYIDVWCDWNNDVRGLYVSYTCNNEGTTSSFCSDVGVIRNKEACVACEDGMCVGGNCNTPADEDCNGCVNDYEFPDAVFNWKEQLGDIPDANFPTVVFNWKGQQGC